MKSVKASGKNCVHLLCSMHQLDMEKAAVMKKLNRVFLSLLIGKLYPSTMQAGYTSSQSMELIQILLQDNPSFLRRAE